MSAGPAARTAAETIADAGDPRLEDYRRLKDRDLSAAGDRFVAESERVVRRLLESGLPVLSVLATPVRLAALADAILDARSDARSDARGAFPVYEAAQDVMDRIAGFHVHRGCLAIGRRPTNAAVPADARAIVVVEDLVDVDNLGACVRNAAAFGAGALVLSPRAADPFYRKAIRVALGSTFHLPIVRLRDWPGDLRALARGHGFEVVGTVLDEAATPLADAPRPPKLALVLGAEGPGLSTAARAACDRLVTIPMAPGADSLNVATAGAIALFHFLSPRARPAG